MTERTGYPDLWVQIQEAMVRNGCDSSQHLMSFLESIQAPDDLLYVGIVLDNFRAIAEVCLIDSDTAPKTMTGIPAAAFPSLISGLLKVIQLSELEITLFPVNPSNRNPYNRHGIVERPVYAALVQQPDPDSPADSQWKLHYFYALTYYWCCATQLERELRDGSRDNAASVWHTIRNTGLRIRQNARQKNWQEPDGTLLIAIGLLDTDGLDSWRDALTRVDYKNTDELTVSLKKIQSHLDLIDESSERGATTRIGSRHRSPPRSSGFWLGLNVFSEAISEADDDDTPDPPERIITHQTQSKRRPTLIDEPSDAVTREIALIDQTKGRHWVASQAAYIWMARQSLPNSIRELSPIQLRPVIEKITHNARTIDNSEIVDLIGAMLWTGLSIDRIKKLSQRGVARISGQSYYSPENRTINLYCPVPAWENHEFRPNARETARWVELPDINGHVTRYKFNEMGTGLTNLKRLVNIELDSFEGPNYLNARRISNALYFFAISRRVCDVTTATLLFGRSIEGLSELHYSAINRYEAQDKHREICELFLKACGFRETEANEVLGQRIVNDENKKEIHVGSKSAPKTDYLRGQLEQLRRVIVKTKKSRYLTDRIKYHNALTLYTWLSFSIAVGARAISDPVPRLDKLFTVDGISYVILREKGGDYNNRMVYVPEVIYQQLILYFKHLDDFSSSLRIHANYRDNALLKDSSPVLLDANGDPVSIRPAGLHETLGDDFNLPINSPRVNLRTELIATVQHWESIQYVMGHWRAGQEPWGLYSHLSLVDSLAPTIPSIDSLLQDLNFMVCGGL